MIISNQDMNGRIDEFHRTPPAPQCICTRCGGLLVNELSIDLWSCTNELEHGARRCVQCGDVIDAVILRNRRIQLLSGSLSSTATHAASLGAQAAA
jgi:hypothetical protein